jgi:histidinol-phosphate aminotransferase
MDFNKIPFSPRQELERFESYQPGLSIEQIKRQYNLKSVVKLASNENSLGPSRKALSAYKRVEENLFRYPETRSVDLRRQIADKHRLDMSQVVIGAGSDEVIEMLAKAFLSPASDVVVSASAFIQYRLAAHLMGSTVITVPMKDMKHDLMGMARAATAKTRFAFIANPNNPTGTYNTAAEVDAFLNSLPANVIPVFDEAYFEYASFRPDYPSVVRDFFKKRPLVVLRTFSKIYGLAGLRVGYGLAPEPLVKALDRIRPPFNVSIPAQAAASEALMDEDHVKKSVEMNEKEKKVVSAELETMGFPVVPSATNFILLRTEPWTGRFLFDRLLQRGVIVRCVDEYQLPNCLRVTIGKPDENKIFLKALKEVLKNP